MIDAKSTEPITLSGSCHCGAVKFTAELPQGLASARRCTCSICRMRGAVAVTGSLDGFTIHQGEDKLATYRFNTGVAQHHFCRHCGIHSFYTPRSAPDGISVNVRCLDGVDFAAVRPNPFDGMHWEEAMRARLESGNASDVTG